MAAQAQPMLLKIHLIQIIKNGVIYANTIALTKLMAHSAQPQ